jgi:hypothetical protein
MGSPDPKHVRTSYVEGRKLTMGMQLMAQHTASPDSVCLPVTWAAFAVVLADLNMLVSGALGRGVFPRIKQISIRLALLFLLLLIFPLVLLAVLFTGCGLV